MKWHKASYDGRYFYGDTKHDYAYIDRTGSGWRATVPAAYDGGVFKTLKSAKVFVEKAIKDNY